ncbi:glycoside hydrolase [Saccharicrinis fermentans]|uniref:O-glycosyl hydrolase n=1 Tax=Saccharicrinis fermentans DSM 9555 = JCM 21142 TaxID=869213 RepID=W7YCK1_9BACT|nr:glycoside hydrolase [Saccharicrinis fermentans]GAF02186.1 O-glycosyl hydrolase [Saccharicrinis fermentans DSM 9555 = JCM 21142]
MYIKQTITLLALIFVIVCSCSTNNNSGGAAQEVLVNENQTYQTMEGFGASDCWTIQFVGANWPEAKREGIADLLFSKEIDQNGNPKGIGLSQWRFNIGGGTAEQGDQSGIPNVWRRAECFLNSDGTYDWNRQLGQQWFLHAAQKRGVESLLAFNNTPPVQYTKNGKGWSPGGDRYNLQADKYDDYAHFLVEVCKYFESIGVNFDYVSPFNEPQWDWKAPATQEGTPARNKEIAQLVNELSPLLAQQFPAIKIAVPEAAQLQFLYEKRGYENRDNQLKELFDSSSDSYIMNLPNVKNAVMGHSYFTTSKLDTLIEVRRKLKNYLNTYHKDLAYWQSEFCILEKHKDIGGGNKRDLGMATALYVARVIHADLALADASLWSWWTAVSPMDYKDGLVYIDLGAEQKGETKYENLREDGYFRDSKTLWVLGNYSRFVQPGMIRILTNLSNKLSLKEQMNQLMISGYKSADDRKYTFVVVNYGNENNTLSFNYFLKDKKNVTITSYVTSKDKNLEKTNVNGANVNVPARSVVSIVME